MFNQQLWEIVKQGLTPFIVCNSQCELGPNGNIRLGLWGEELPSVKQPRS